MQDNLNEIIHDPEFVAKIASTARAALYIAKDVKFYYEAIEVLRVNNPSMGVPERINIIKDIVAQFANYESYRLISLIEFKNYIPAGETLIRTLRCGGITQEQLLQLTQLSKKGTVDKCRVVGILALKKTQDGPVAAFKDGTASKLTGGADIKYYFVYSFAECEHKLLQQLVASSSLFVQKSLLRKNEPLPFCFSPDYEFDENVLESIKNNITRLVAGGNEVDCESLDIQGALLKCDASFTFLCVNDVSLIPIEDSNTPNEEHSIYHNPISPHILVREVHMEKWRRVAEEQLSQESFLPDRQSREVWPDDEFSGRFAKMLFVGGESSDSEIEVLEEGAPRAPIEVESDENTPSLPIASSDDDSSASRRRAKRGRFTHTKVLVKDEAVAGTSTQGAGQPSTSNTPDDASAYEKLVLDMCRSQEIQKKILSALSHKNVENIYCVDDLNQLLDIDNIVDIKTVRDLSKMKRTCAKKGSPPTTHVLAIILTEKKRHGTHSDSDFAFIIQGQRKKRRVKNPRTGTHSELLDAAKELSLNMISFKKAVDVPRMMVGVGTSFFHRFDSSGDEDDSD